MPSSSIVTLPGIAAVFSTMQPYAQGTFDNFELVVLYGLGILLGALTLVFVVGALWGGLVWAFHKLQDMMWHRASARRLHALDQSMIDSFGDDPSRY